jgi:type IX secretion system PorP/SprF family membrane protein
MMRRYLTILLIITAVMGRLFGQQEPHYTLYMLNPYIINPAEAGIADYYQIRTNHRFQWAGMKDAPITNSISCFGPHTTKSMGFGGEIYNDITGPISHTGFSGTYAYNTPVTRDISVSGGLSLGFIQYKFDGTKTSLSQEYEYDPTFHPVVYSGVTPDASAGVYAWSPGAWYGGFSVRQLLNSSMTISDLGTKLDRLKPHYYLIGGYKYDASPRKNHLWDIEPSLILSKVVPSPYQIEVDAKCTYKKMLWAGLSYRSGDAVSFLMGYNYMTSFYIGYAYDYPLSDIRQYTLGSHEIVIGYRFDQIRNKKGGFGKGVKSGAGGKKSSSTNKK